MILYRGTQRTDLKGRLKFMSFTPSLPVAIIWSAVNHGFGRVELTKTSTVHRLHANLTRGVDFSEGPQMSLGDVLRQLNFGEEDGITAEEALKIYNYMINRLLGKAFGGDFHYQLLDEDGEPLDYGFDLRRFDLHYHRDDFEYAERETLEQQLEIADQLTADTFIFADAPAVAKSAIRQGYDYIVYHDVFQGGTAAAKTLFGLDVEDLDGVELLFDHDSEFVPTHETYRILSVPAVELVESRPAVDLLGVIEMVDADGVMHGVA